MTSAPSIAIIGGGPSGLVFARLLELNGIGDYVIFERDASAIPGPYQQGGTLDLHATTGQLALQRAGLFDKFSKELARWDGASAHVMDAAGKSVIRLAGSNRPEIDRLQLRQLLLDSIPAHKIRWGHAVSAIDRSDDTSDSFNYNGYVIQFSGGTSATGFRLIVGADGAWSKVRPLLTTVKPMYSGKMYLEGRVSHHNPSYECAQKLAGPGHMMAIGGHKQIAVQQVADGTYRVYFGLIVPEDFYQHRPNGHSKPSTGHNAEDQTEQLRHLIFSSHDYFANWAPELKTFVQHAEGSFRSWALYRIDPDKLAWARSAATGVTLLGDAAHVSTPFVGEGVNCSMYDAIVLADSIIKHCGKEANLASQEQASALETALAVYEENMFTRGRDLIRRSTDSENRLFAENAAEQFLEFVEALQH